MPDRRPVRRFGAAAALASVVIALAMTGAPAVLAQTDDPTRSDPARWEGSGFTVPFEEGKAVVTQESFPISGVFLRTRQAAERITTVEVDFGREEDETTEAPPPDAEAPPESEVEVECIPPDQEFVGGDAVSEDGTTVAYEFTVPAEQSVWPCNGRYEISATATSSTGPNDTHQITGVLTVAVPPKPVTVVAAQVLDGKRDVRITWQPLAEEDLAVDAIGYRVERAGPARDGDFGRFTALGADRALDQEAAVTDSPRVGGEYRYRVRALRSGADGPVPSLAEETAVAEATVAGAPVATTTTTKPNRPRTGVINRPRPTRTTPSLGPPTTVDTGFEGELDYGDREPGDSPELAGDSGRSIINTDDAGTGFAAPVAGALVLLGWAGHITYLNRLAKQF